MYFILTYLLKKGQSAVLTIELNAEHENAGKPLHTVQYKVSSLFPFFITNPRYLIPARTLGKRSLHVVV